MKSIFRLYAKTSKGNDPHLYRQLKSFNLNPKYDPHLNAFYFNGNFNTLFDLSFHSLTIQNMYVQIGQRFSLIDQSQISQELHNLQFKNFIPISRKLVQNTTLKILIRQCSIIPSQNVLTSLITNILSKQVVKKQYYKNIISQSNQNMDNLLPQSSKEQKNLILKNKQRANSESYYEIRDTVQRKWHQQDVILQQEQKKRLFQLENQILRIQKSLKTSNKQSSATNIVSQDKNLISVEDIQKNLILLQKEIKQIQYFNVEQYLQKLLPYHPHLIFYARKNKGRMLLKVNEKQMYKHGWKTAVNWGPIRQSIAASVIYQSKIIDQYKKSLNSKTQLKIWDPFCGSGTFPLVAMTMLNNIPIHSNIQKIFNWQHWKIFKQQYLDQYIQQRKNKQQSQRNSNFKLILSDISLQSINYSIQNFRELLKHFKIQQTANCSKQKLFPNSKPIDQIFQLLPNKIGFFCEDFQKVMESLIPQGDNQLAHLNIVSNLPYLNGRSKEKHPLNQLQSIYKRFNKMIHKYQKHFDNIFIVVDRNTKDWRHFVNQSSQKWTMISEYTSGGFQIGLYAWQNNKIKSTYDQTENKISTLDNTAMTLTPKQKQIVVNKERSIGNALTQYRKKLSLIQKKYYNLPSHLKKTKKGWRRIKQKRRVRHLQLAYKIFCKRRDKIIAFKQYSRKKLQIGMLRRGTIWKQKNMKILNNGQQLQKYSNEIKNVFESKIQQAIQRQQQRQKRRRQKSMEKMEEIKIKNKWNNDPQRLIQQAQKSSSRQFKKYNRQLNDGTLKFQDSIKNKRHKYPIIKRRKKN